MPMTPIEDMRDSMLKIMQESLREIAKGLHTSAENKMDAVQRWLKIMRTMMPEHVEQTFQAIMKELEEQNKRTR